MQLKNKEIDTNSIEYSMLHALSRQFSWTLARQGTRCLHEIEELEYELKWKLCFTHNVVELVGLKTSLSVNSRHDISEHTCKRHTIFKTFLRSI